MTKAVTRLAEFMSFGGSDLDRSAHLRRDADALKQALEEDAGIVALWRGKPLILGDPAEGSVSLVRLQQGDPVLSAASEPPLFLGRFGADAVFAQDVSGWEPVEPPDEAQMNSFMDRSVQRHPAAPNAAAFRELRATMTALDARDAELAATARALIGWHRTHRFCARCGAATDSAEAGWQRVCPSCGAHHFPRTDPVVIMLITDGDRVLLGRSPGWPERMYSLLAGFVEPGETIEAAVRREVFEETRVRVGEVGYLAGQPWPYPSSLMIGCVGRALSDAITVDPEEIEAARWVTRSELLEVFAGTHPQIAAARRGAIAHAILRQWLAGQIV